MEKWLLASDIHFPKQDDRAVELLLKVIKQWKPDAIDFVGDIDDAEGTSRWADGNLAESNNPIVEDMKIIQQFFGDVRKIAKTADIHLHDGNHGWTRHNNYIQTKAKALDGVITPDFLYGISKFGMNFHYYSEPPVKRLGEFYVHHGMAISKHAGQSVQGDMENWDVPLIRGHSHRMGAYYKTTMARDLEGFEIGHMSDLKQMTYTNHHNWQMGFAYAHVVDGKAHVNLVKIKDYSCVIDGKLISV